MYPLTSVTTFAFAKEEFWFTTVGLIGPPVANCMVRAAASDFTVEELFGGETLMPSFSDFASSSVIFSA